MMPPLMTVGSIPPASSSAATRLVVVVLPFVPAIATVDLRRISSASISARRTMGIRTASAASTSGLPRLTAGEVSTTAEIGREAGGGRGWEDGESAAGGGKVKHKNLS